jgi:mono/diheme cytochrome c family protein
VFFACLLAAVAGLGQKSQPQAPGPAPTTKATQPAKKNQQNDGEQKFQINCGRCHNPPDQLSPRIAGTVIRHMRVRAMLSEEDAREILEYLAP